MACRSGQRGFKRVGSNIAEGGEASSQLDNAYETHRWLLVSASMGIEMVSEIIYSH